jgi:hypothetical protein
MYVFESACQSQSCFERLVYQQFMSLALINLSIVLPDRSEKIQITVRPCSTSGP